MAPCAHRWGARPAPRAGGVAFFEFVAQEGRKPNEGAEQDQLRAHATAIAAAKAEWPAICRAAHDRRVARFERIAHGRE
jgi:hypothetical protein